MARVLILFAHPALSKSRVHRGLLAHLPDLPGLTFHDLYEAYPTFDVDVAREQALLTEHDVVVLQFPMYWYSTPPLLKQWEDLVLEHGWAYGSTGTALHGKRLICALSAGGRQTAYRHGGYNRFTIREFLQPLEQTGRLCGMTYLPPFVIHGTHGMTRRAIEEAGRAYGELVTRLHGEGLDPSALEALDTVNPVLEAAAARTEVDR